MENDRGQNFVHFDQESREDEIELLRRKAVAYKQVFYGVMSPLEIGELVIDREVGEANTRDEKRQVKCDELDDYGDKFLKTYYVLCDLNGEKPNLAFLMENGFGLGAGDLFDEKSIDELIARDEQIIGSRGDSE